MKDKSDISYREYKKNKDLNEIQEMIEEIMEKANKEITLEEVLSK